MLPRACRPGRDGNAGFHEKRYADTDHSHDLADREVSAAADHDHRHTDGCNDKVSILIQNVKQVPD